jgi:hypothetical protein
VSLSYVPAGAEGYSERRVQLQITNKPNEKETSEHGKLYKRWRTNTKTVTVVATTNRGGILSDDGADLIVPILNSTFIKNCGLTKILANPIHGDFVKAPFEVQGIESIVDSGGFQMLKGTVDFVEPDPLIKLYNAQANIGMPLDLPVPSKAEPFFFDAVSKMIRANDDYMLKRLNKNVDLALISHGSTLERRKSRLDVLDRKAAVVAIAGLNIKPPPGTDHLISALESLMYVVHRYHKTARYFHVLGVTSKFWIFIYALLDASKYVKSIGADSVSHRLGGLVGMYETADFQTIQLNKQMNYRQPPPCTCPVCISIDDMRLLNLTYILEAHNLYAKAEQTEMLRNLAAQYVQGQLTLKVVFDLLKLRVTFNEFSKLIKYVETIISTDKFRPLRKQNINKSLFAPRALKEHPRKDLYTKILTSYGKFHGKRFL